MALLGLSYRSADVAVRSLAALTGDRHERFIGLLREHGFSEGVVLSTCNRTEIYTVGGDPDRVVELLARSSGLGEAELRPHLYAKAGVCAACHLFRVACGLDSAVLGETEIVAQIKSAWRDATLNGPILDLLFQRAIEASKRVRTETALCRNVTSLGSLAVREANRAVGSLRDRSVMLLGAGQIAERVAKELSSLGATQVTVVNRTAVRGKDFAERFGFAWVPFEELSAQLVGTEVVFATTSAAEPVITQENLLAGCSPVVIDLGIPPNVNVPGLEVLDVDELAAKCSLNSEARTAAIPDALDILEQELNRLLVAVHERQAAPTIRVLVDHGEAVRQRTLDWAMDRLPNISEKERRVVEDLARRIMLGMLTPPIEELKKGNFSSDERATVERAFRVSSEERDR